MIIGELTIFTILPVARVWHSHSYIDFPDSKGRPVRDQRVEHLQSVTRCWVRHKKRSLGKPSIATTPRAPKGARPARQPFTRRRAMPATPHQHIATVMRVAADGAGAQAAAGDEQAIRDSWLRCVQQHRLDRQPLRLTSTIPAATPSSASTSCSVSGSPSSTTPNTSANTGVRNVKVDICVAG